MIPSSSAGHGVTYAQNVARDVAVRIDAIDRARRMWLVLGVGSVPGSALTLWLLHDVVPPEYLVSLWTFVLGFPIGLTVLFGFARRAAARAGLLDRARDVSWVTQRQGLVFFTDDTLFIEKGVGLVPFDGHDWAVSVEGERMVLTRSAVSPSSASYKIEVFVPPGWTDEDTARIVERVHGQGRRRSFAQPAGP